MKTMTSYEKFKYLDFDALNYNGSWQWQFGTRFSGKLSASRSESLAPFEDALGTQRNVRIVENQAFDVDAWAFGGWHLLLGVIQDDQSSEQSSILNRSPDFRSTSGSIGVKYLSRAGNTITVRRQKTDGNYTNSPLAALNSDYVENLTELGADWRINGNSTINGRIGWLDRANANIARRDFSGPSSNFNYLWEPRGKLSLAISFARKTSPLQDLTASYREENSISATPSWRTSDKTSAFLTLSTLKGEDKGGVPLPGLTPRKDTTNSATAGLNWAATRTLSFNASVQVAQRTSNVALADYDATIAKVGAAISF